MIEYYEDSHESAFFYEDVNAWRYVTKKDLSKGMPYFDEHEELQYASKISRKSDDYLNLDVHLRHEQHMQYCESLVKFVMHKIKQATWSEDDKSDADWGSTRTRRRGVLFEYISQMRAPERLEDFDNNRDLWQTMWKLYCSTQSSFATVQNSNLDIFQ